MESEWQTMTLGEVIELKRGYDLPSRDRKEGSVPIVSSSGVSGYHSESKIKAPGVVTGRYGTLGKVFFITTDFWPLNTALYVRDFKGNDPRFISYFLKTIDFFVYSDKAAVPGVNRNHLHSADVRVPPLKEQQAIACILGALDDKIEVNRRMNGTLEAMARAIFQDWFVDFGPVRAKAAGQAPAGLAAAVAALFPARLVEVAGRVVPEGWEVKKLPEIIDVNPKRLLSKGAIAPYLDMANMPILGPSPGSWINREFGSGMKFMNGDTLVARITPCLENGKTAFVDFLTDNEVGWGSTEYIVLRPKGKIPPVFAYILARTEDFRTFAIHQMTGSSGRQRVPADSLANFYISSPEVNSQLFHQFGNYVTPLFSRIRESMNQSRTLAALRDALLPKLIAGEMRVADAERVVARCL